MKLVTVALALHAVVLISKDTAVEGLRQNPGNLIGKSASKEVSNQGNEGKIIKSNGLNKCETKSKSKSKSEGKSKCETKIKSEGKSRSKSIEDTVTIRKSNGKSKEKNGGKNEIYSKTHSQKSRGKNEIYSKNQSHSSKSSKGKSISKTSFDERMPPTLVPLTPKPTSTPKAPTLAPVTPERTSLPKTPPFVRLTQAPTGNPTKELTSTPVDNPTKPPTSAPVSQAPTSNPTKGPTSAPVTPMPTNNPTEVPTQNPVTQAPSPNPTETPTKNPVTPLPSPNPTEAPTKNPVTPPPSPNPTNNPSKVPPTAIPSFTSNPTNVPSFSSRPSVDYEFAITERATTDKIIYLTKPSKPDSVNIGDIWIWDNNIYEQDNADSIGQSTGRCTRLPNESWSCKFIFVFRNNISTKGNQGQIMAQGSVPDVFTSINLAVTGGIDDFEGMSGSILLVYPSDSENVPIVLDYKFNIIRP